MKNLASLKDAPPLVEIFRGHTSGGDPIVECVHHGLISVVNGLNEEIFSVGHTHTLVHMRSTAKPFQIMPVFESATKHTLALEDIALMMSSHSGQDIHTSRVENLLRQIDCDPAMLRCGIHPPNDDATRKYLAANKIAPSVLHNNCSGKHAAMLMVCKACGYDVDTYEDAHHPLQRRIKNLIKEYGDVDDNEIAFGIDGCSLPSFAVPLNNLALMYARLSYWQDHAPANKPKLADMYKTLWRAATTFPAFIAGDGRLDTEIMKACGTNLFSKTGADGVQAIAVLPSKQFPTGLGIAIKISDGDVRQTIRPLVVKHLLTKLSLWPSHHELDKILPSYRNYRGLETGGARTIF